MRVRPFDFLPGRQKGTIKRGQKARIISRRVGQDSVNSGMKLIRKPERKDSHPARRGGGIVPYPLNQQRRNFNFISTTEKPPAVGGWVTTSRATKSCLPFQKKGKINLASSAWTHRGICIRDATYQILERPKEPINKALFRNDKARCLHDERTFSTAAIRGCQLTSSR